MGTHTNYGENTIIVRKSLSEGRQPRLGRGREQVSELVVELFVRHDGQALARPGHLLATLQVLLNRFDGGPGRARIRRRRRRRGPAAELLLLLRRPSAGPR